ncbi:MAG TPA: hypothetical protein VFA88_08900 [Gaiellaceae bacterium]|nr:hypothetical protein [Gaiellaceae bacterium]
MRRLRPRPGWTAANVVAGALGVALAVGLFVAFLVFVSHTGR